MFSLQFIVFTMFCQQLIVAAMLCLQQKQQQHKVSWGGVGVLKHYVDTPTRVKLGWGIIQPPQSQYQTKWGGGLVFTPASWTVFGCKSDVFKEKIEKIKRFKSL